MPPPCACGVIFAILVAAALTTSCETNTGDDGSNSLGCEWPPDAPSGQHCACFDGDLRCHAACPMDLTAACTVGTACGDFSGGSAGGDCVCVCDPSGTWACSRDGAGGGEACIPY